MMERRVVLIACLCKSRRLRVASKRLSDERVEQAHTVRSRDLDESHGIRNVDRMYRIKSSRVAESKCKIEESTRLLI